MEGGEPSSEGHVDKNRAEAATTRVGSPKGPREGARKTKSLTLLEAADCGDEASVARLLTAGANPNVPFEHPQFNRHARPLHYAARSGTRYGLLQLCACKH